MQIKVLPGRSGSRLIEDKIDDGMLMCFRFLSRNS